MLEQRLEEGEAEEPFFSMEEMREGSEGGVGRAQILSGPVVAHQAMEVLEEGPVEEEVGRRPPLVRRQRPEVTELVLLGGEEVGVAAVLERMPEVGD